MRHPRQFFAPLAIGAPAPLREIPLAPSRMIHFFDPSNERIVAKLPDIAAKADIVLGNLEDAIAVERKEAARAGLVRVGRELDLGGTALWTRVNALESPWALDDITTLVTEIGNRLDVIMVPKVAAGVDWRPLAPASRDPLGVVAFATTTRSQNRCTKPLDSRRIACYVTYRPVGRYGIGAKSRVSTDRPVCNYGGIRRRRMDG
jgi:hypothetical protein